MKNSVSLGMKQATNLRIAFGIFTMALLAFLSSADTLLQLYPISSLKPSGYHKVSSRKFDSDPFCDKVCKKVRFH